MKVVGSLVVAESSTYPTLCKQNHTKGTETDLIDPLLLNCIHLIVDISSKFVVTMSIRKLFPSLLNCL